VIVDEVHERSAESDFLLVFLRNLILGKKCGPKLILMSATLDSNLFTEYFNKCPFINIPGRTYPVREYFLEDILELTGYSPSQRGGREGQGFRRTGGMDEKEGEVEEEEEEEEKLLEEEDDELTDAEFRLPSASSTSSSSALSLQLESLSPTDQKAVMEMKKMHTSVSTVRTLLNLSRFDENRINIDLLVELVLQLHNSSPSASALGSIADSILVFMPGMADILALCERLNYSSR
jgi:HrpA-like RNA helicase